MKHKDTLIHRYIRISKDFLPIIKSTWENIDEEGGPDSIHILAGDLVRIIDQREYPIGEEIPTLIKFLLNKIKPGEFSEVEQYADMLGWELTEGRYFELVPKYEVEINQPKGKVTIQAGGLSDEVGRRIKVIIDCYYFLNLLEDRHDSRTRSIKQKVDFIRNIAEQELLSSWLELFKPNAYDSWLKQVISSDIEPLVIEDDGQCIGKMTAMELRIHWNYMVDMGYIRDEYQSISGSKLKILLLKGLNYQSLNVKPFEKSYWAKAWAKIMENPTPDKRVDRVSILDRFTS